MQTIAQLNASLLKIASEHLQINSYGFGSTTHFEQALIEDESLFPCVWVELDTFTGEETVHTRVINIHVTDMNPNQMQAFSDTEQIALDILHLLRVQNEADGMSVTMAHNMQPLAYRGVDHAHGFQIQIQAEYADAYDACKAPTDVDIIDTCTKVWNTTDAKWDEYGVKWENAGGEKTTIESFTAFPTSYPSNVPKDVELQVDIKVSSIDSDMSYVITGSNGFTTGVQTDRLGAFTDSTKSTSSVSYTLVVTYKDCNGVTKNIGDTANVIVVPTVIPAYTGYSDNGTDVVTLISEIENPANIGFNPAELFQIQSKSSLENAFTINPGQNFKYHIIAVPQSYGLDKIFDVTGIDVTNGFTIFGSQTINGNTYDIYSAFVSGGLPVQYEMQ